MDRRLRLFDLVVAVVLIGLVFTFFVNLRRLERAEVAIQVVVEDLQELEQRPQIERSIWPVAGRAIPHRFENGSYIVAKQFNENFDAIERALQNLNARAYLIINPDGTISLEARAQ